MTVIDSRRVPATPCPARHLNTVSDPHVVASQPVKPTVASPLKSLCPRDAPWIVTLAEPVPATFVLRSVLEKPISAEIPSDALPTLAPIVIITRRVPDTPCPEKHRTPVEESHSVDSQP
eukprot:2066210-Rhodomonas_salina.1